jgi:outer membrane protein assembly factor BamB
MTLRALALAAAASGAAASELGIRPTLLWEASLPGGVAPEATPAVDAAGVSYWGTLAGWVYALYPNGSQAWAFDAGSPVTGPLVLNNAQTTLVFGTGGAASGAVNALWTDGVSGLRWAVPTGAAVRCAASFYSGPYLGIGSDDGFVYYLSTATGATSWTLSLDAPVRGVALDTSDWVFATATNGRVVYVHGTSGNERWRYATGGSIPGAPVVAPNGDVVIGSADGYVYKLDAQQGTVTWSAPAPGPVAGGLALGPSNRVFFAASLDTPGVFAALVSLTQGGASNWVNDASAVVGPVTSTPAYSAPSGLLFFGSHGGVLLGAMADDGSTVAPGWAAVVGAPNDTLTSVAVTADGETVLVALSSGEAVA